MANTRSVTLQQNNTDSSDWSKNIHNTLIPLVYDMFEPGFRFSFCRRINVNYSLCDITKNNQYTPHRMCLLGLTYDCIMFYSGFSADFGIVFFVRLNRMFL